MRALLWCAVVLCAGCVELPTGTLEPGDPGSPAPEEVAELMCMSWRDDTLWVGAVPLVERLAVRVPCRARPASALRPAAAWSE